MPANATNCLPKLSVENFGPIAKASIQLRPLTVFAGPSNTGKSYLAILTHALHKSCTRLSSGHGARAYLDPFFEDIAMRSGSLAEALESPKKRERVARELSDLATGFADAISDESLSGGRQVGPTPVLDRLIRDLLESAGEFGEVLGAQIVRSFGVESANSLIRRNARSFDVNLMGCGPSNGESIDPIGFEFAHKRSRGLFSFSVPAVPNAHLNALAASNPTALRRWTQQLRLRGFHVDLDPQSSSLRLAQSVAELCGSILGASLDPFNRDSHYLPADRTGVMNAQRVVVSSLIAGAPLGGSRSRELMPAMSGVLSDFFRHLLELRPVESGRGNGDQRLAKSFEGSILRGRIISNYDTGYPEYSYMPEGWKRDLPLMNASSMVSELAPVILYLRHIVNPGELLIIEEPESHLHPAMQVEFTKQLAAAVKAGIRILITTHSEIVLEEIANLVRLSELPKGRRRGIPEAAYALSSDDVGAWFFEPKNRPKGSIVKEIGLDVDSGTFPMGFNEVTEQLYDNWVTVDSRLRRSGEV